LRIQNKLFLTLLATSIIAVTILVVLMQWSVGRGMVEYINHREADKLEPVIEELATRYGRHQDWQWLENRPDVLRQILFQNLLFKRHDDHCEDDDDCDEIKRPFTKRPDLIVLDDNKVPVVEIRPKAKTRSLIEIEWNDRVVGWLSVPQRLQIADGIELLFLKQQQKAFWMMSFIVIVLAALIAFPLARHFVRPIEQLNRGTHKLTQGDYQFHLPVNRNDELGQLARDFNELAKTLEQNDGLRKRWVADISHELRTPIAILQGEIEAMLDGVRPLSEANLQSMKEEIDQLNKLVNDLYELSKADIGGLSYRKANVNVTELVKTKLASYQTLFSQHDLTLNVDYQAPCFVYADSSRLNQLLDNLLTNTLRYTQSGGQVNVTVYLERDQVVIELDDSEPGVPSDSLHHLFDYLYRTEQSRNRELGGSGLGLAICKRIVEGHGGEISASHSELGGLTIRVQLPKQS
jgi:two-component system sensor histidine kinase BaeS